MKTIEDRATITSSDVTNSVVDDLSSSFDGNMLWITTVKLHLEARGLIERIPGTSPHQLQIKA